MGIPKMYRANSTESQVHGDVGGGGDSKIKATRIVVKHNLVLKSDIILKIEHFCNCPQPTNWTTVKRTI